VEHVERAKDAGDLASNEALGLRPFACEPGAEVSVLRVFHREAVAHARPSTSANRSKIRSARGSRVSSSAKYASRNQAESRSLILMQTCAG
jgi:hypothetical protein